MMRSIGSVGLGVSLATTCIPSLAIADRFFESGNTLLEDCQNPAPIYCMGYVTGVIDAASFAEEPLRGWDFCLPNGVTTGQTMDVVVLWLEENPSQRHFSAGYTVLRAMTESFPCD
jgi:hypothetical protein